MCGIIGILARRPVADLLLDGLKRLEYRGYDSAGIATLEQFPKQGTLTRLRAAGKLAALADKLAANPLAGHSGIGHTRWATHGGPSERNAHPHMTDHLAVVHNGIIENFAPLREKLQAQGYVFDSDTDTEVVAHLVSDFLTRGKTPAEAVQAAMGELQGAFALAFIFQGQEDLLIAARQGPPLAIGHGEGESEGEIFVGSDAIALAPFTSRITYLEDGDIAVLSRSHVIIMDRMGKPQQRAEQQVSASFLVSKGNYRHFMQKEMFEQPEVAAHALARYLDFGAGRVRGFEHFSKKMLYSPLGRREAPSRRAAPVSAKNDFDWQKYSSLSFASCGTAHYATLVARYWFERLAGLRVDSDVASEFRYREPPLDPNGLTLFVSQSGETADTLACLRYCQSQRVDTAAIVNVEHSSIAREADFTFPTLAGPEIGVASTKAFTAQLVTLVSLALGAGVARGVIDEKQEQRLVSLLAEVPRFITQALKLEKQIESLCRELVGVRHALYLGRGSAFPIALEGALKLKELSYIHAEGYAAGELKHGPIALIDETMPVIVLAPRDRWFEKTVSNMQEVAARGGRIILITDEAGAEQTGLQALTTLIMPDVDELISPLIYAIPMQLIAYHTAVSLGTDVDQPRNLAKSVTVE